MGHPHTPEWFRDLYAIRNTLTAAEFYAEFWQRQSLNAWNNGKRAEHERGESLCFYTTDQPDKGIEESNGSPGGKHQL